MMTAVKTKTTPGKVRAMIDKFSGDQQKTIGSVQNFPCNVFLHYAFPKHKAATPTTKVTLTHNADGKVACSIL